MTDNKYRVKDLYKEEKIDDINKADAKIFEPFNGKVTTAFLNCRKSPGFESEFAPRGPIKGNTEVRVISEAEASDGSKWYEVSYSNETFFVHADYIDRTF